MRWVSRMEAVEVAIPRAHGESAVIDEGGEVDGLRLNSAGAVAFILGIDQNIPLGECPWHNCHEELERRHVL